VKVDNITSIEALLQAIQRAGYRGSLQDDTHKVNEIDKRQKETKSWLKKFI
jgi:hypothetical protein